MPKNNRKVPDSLLSRTTIYLILIAILLIIICIYEQRLIIPAIIAIIAGIGVISYNSFFATGEANYYKALESDVLLATNDYFLDNRDKLPVAEEYSEVEISDLINGK